MTKYERGWYQWLRRELAAELGVPHRVGRPRALSPAQEARVFDAIKGAPAKRRGKVLAQLSRDLGSPIPTLENVLTRHAAQHGCMRALRSTINTEIALLEIL